MTVAETIRILKKAASEAKGDLAVALNIAIEMLETQEKFNELFSEVRY